MKRAGTTFAASALLLIYAICWPAGTALADGGTIQLSTKVKPYTITLFTSPSPLRAGAIDASVLVQDAASGAVLPDVRIKIKAVRADRTMGGRTFAATRAAATNKLFQAAQFELDEPGRWQLSVVVEGPRGTAEVGCPIEVAAAAARWSEMWLWIGWPFLVMAAFVLQKILARSRMRIEQQGFGTRLRASGCNPSAR